MEQTLLLAERTYKAEPYAGSALLIRFHDEAWQYGPDPLMGWSGLIKGGIDVVDLKGGHITGMRSLSTPTMVAVLRDHMDHSEAPISMTGVASPERAPSSLRPNAALTT